MEKIESISPDWEVWIHHNLARGCSTQSLIERMVKRNFNEDFALATVAQIASSKPIKKTESHLSSDTYIYDKPRFPQSGNVLTTTDRDVHVAFRIQKPVIAVLDNLLSAEECSNLIEAAKAKLERSKIVDPETGKSKVIEDRSSYTAHFTRNENELISKIDRRISEVMQLPVENGEGLQILNYQINGEYRPHFDYFAPEKKSSEFHLSRGGQRVSTLIIYLNNVESGGETVFPKINLSVAPRQGSAVYFEYFNQNSQLDSQTLHGGNPVQIGEKWIATKWMREGIFR